jgi:hypothetical protein
MKNWIYILGAAIGGFALGMGFKKPEQKKEGSKMQNYWVWVVTMNGDKFPVEFYTYIDAANFFEKYAKNKKITWGEIVKLDKTPDYGWKAIYEKDKKEFIKDQPLTESEKIAELYWGHGDTTFEEKEFT